MSPEVAGILEAGAQALGVRLDPGARDRISRFLDLLAVWNRRIRLTAEQDERTIVTRHVVDSLAPVPHLPASGLIVDVGSGGGFPGIILGCVRPDLDLVLIDSRRRRVSFLAEAIRTVHLPRARTLALRAEHAGERTELRGRAVVVLSRAVRLDVLLACAAPLLAPGGVVLAMRTPGHAAEARRAAAEEFAISAEQPYVLPDGRRRVLVTLRRR